MVNDEVLKQLIATMLNVDVSIIGEDASMDNLENWDSLRHMNIILALQEEFNVFIPDEDVGNITSYKLIKLVLTELMAQKG